MTGRRWTTEVVRRELAPFVDLFNRMPTAAEVRSFGRNDLAVAVQRHGPKTWEGWAREFGVDVKDSAARLGKIHEDKVESLLVSLGLSVERQHYRAPFDLLVNGRVRIDVKSSRWHSYVTPRGDACSGYFCGLTHGRWTHNCDLYAICCADGEQAGDIYWIPVDAARIKQITITPDGKYSPFRNNIDALTTAANQAA